MDASSIKSSELYTAAKIIGRECSEANLDYYNCKKELGENPKACKSQGSRVNKCVTAIVKNASKSFPAEFAAFEKCLDKNDFRIGDCRQTEKALLDSWNAAKGYTAPAAEE